MQVYVVLRTDQLSHAHLDSLSPIGIAGCQIIWCPSVPRVYSKKCQEQAAPASAPFTTTSLPRAMVAKRRLLLHLWSAELGAKYHRVQCQYAWAMFDRGLLYPGRHASDASQDSETRVLYHS